MSLVGSLEELGLGEILQIVSLSRKSGILSLHSRGREGRIVFRNGQVIRASSSSFQQNIGEVLVQKGIIDLATLRQSLQIQKDNGFRERLGSILTRCFDISADSIENVVRGQVEDVVYSLFVWAEGSFEFEVQEPVDVIDNTRLDPVQFMLDQGLNPQFLAMEGTRIVDEKRHRGEIVDELHETPRAVPEREPDVDLAFDLLHVAKDAVVDHQVCGNANPGRMVLLVDDDPVTRDVLAGFLASEGCEIHALGKSEDAIILTDTLYREGKRPTVLVDLIMPKMDGTGVLGGMELLELLYNNFADLHVLVIGEYRNREAERTIRSYGYSFLLKPRKSDIVNPQVLPEFRNRFLGCVERIRCGEVLSGLGDKVDIGDELRLELGDEASERTVAVSSTGVSLLRWMLEELNDPSLGGGVVLLVLRFASEFMNRAVVFGVKPDAITGLGQFGIEDEEGHADIRIRNLVISRDGESLFRNVIESVQPLKCRAGMSELDRYLLDQLGGGTPSEIFIGPIIREGTVVAVLYGDNLPDNRPIGDTESLEIFLSQAGVAMEKALLLRRLREKDQEVA
jgi:CheY-like chemotaxis protein